MQLKSAVITHRMCNMMKLAVQLMLLRAPFFLLIRPLSVCLLGFHQASLSPACAAAQVADQAVPVTKEVTDGVVRPAGKAVGEAAAELGKDENRAKVGS